ncbi:ImcF-related family protein [Pseudomonas sp. PCH446]
MPWYQRFGLNQNPALLEVLWPRYVEANNRLLRDPMAEHLKAQLNALIQLPPDSPERLNRAQDAHAQLKAYLMMAQPEKADAAFLAQTLGKVELSHSDRSAGLWYALSPNLLRFYAEQLAAHPAWCIEADPLRVTQARQILLNQLGQRNAEAALYQQVLDKAAPHYPALSLRQMLDETATLGLFSTTATVPGVFTRQAWEGQVRQAIDEIAQARREEVDWVLSDKHAEIDPRMSPEELRKRLTERYFQDYAGVWLDFLNSLRWHPADSLGAVIDQLTLMSDIRQSPLIGLMNTLAYQGQAGTRARPWRLADPVRAKADGAGQGGGDRPTDADPSSPLDTTFGPLLALLKDPSARVALSA